MITEQLVCGDNLSILPTLPDNFATFIYIDPPFNTTKIQKRERIAVKEAKGTEGDRIGFGGKSFTTTKLIDNLSYEDSFDNFEEFLMPRIEASLHCLTKNGSIMVHLDWREVHYIKVAMDKLLGREKFMNEIIWSYDYGARSKTKWPTKHDTILWYVLNPKDYIFNYDAMERIPYMAPGLVGKEKAERGKSLTDVIWNTIVPTMGKEKTGYPTQKPIGLINKFIKVHTNPGDTVLDFFAGSGTTGASAKKHDRGYVLIDQNQSAIDICSKRLTTVL